MQRIEHFHKNKIQNPTLFLSTKKLAIILGLTSILIGVIAYFPLSQVFTGSWKLSQFVTLLPDAKVMLPSNDLTTPLFGPATSPGIVELKFGDLNLRFFSLFVVLGMFSGYVLALYLSKLNFVVGTIIDRLFIGLVIFGLIGARLLFVLANLSSFAAEPWTILTEITSGGMAWVGALIFGMIYVRIYISRYQFNYFEFLDFLAPSVLLGQIVGGFGSMFNYESYGPQTSLLWKMYVPSAANISENLNASFFHPTFLYQILLLLPLLLFLLYFYRSFTAKSSGMVFAIYLVGFGLIRFFLEFLRLDALIADLPSWAILRFNVSGVSFEITKVLVSQVLAFSSVIAGFVIFDSRKNILYKKKFMTETPVR